MPSPAPRQAFESPPLQACLSPFSVSLAASVREGVVGPPSSKLPLSRLGQQGEGSELPQQAEGIVVLDRLADLPVLNAKDQAGREVYLESGGVDLAYYCCQLAALGAP